MVSRLRARPDRLRFVAALLAWGLRAEEGAASDWIVLVEQSRRREEPQGRARAPASDPSSRRHRSGQPRDPTDRHSSHQKPPLNGDHAVASQARLSGRGNFHQAERTHCSARCRAPAQRRDRRSRGRRETAEIRRGVAASNSRTVTGQNACRRAVSQEMSDRVNDGVCAILSCALEYSAACNA